MTYGFVRLEVIGAMVSVMTIWLLTGILVYEGVLRLQRFSANPNRKEVREGERERELHYIIHIQRTDICTLGDTVTHTVPSHTSFR